MWVGKGAWSIYVWGRRYDILCLSPNTFPYGGVENPCVSTIILIE